MSKILKLLKYVEYLPLLEDVADAISAARAGQEFHLTGSYRVKNQRIDITITGKRRPG